MQADRLRYWWRCSPDVQMQRELESAAELVLVFGLEPEQEPELALEHGQEPEQEQQQQTNLVRPAQQAPALALLEIQAQPEHCTRPEPSQPAKHWANCH